MPRAVDVDVAAEFVAVAAEVVAVAAEFVAVVEEQQVEGLARSEQVDPRLMLQSAFAAEVAEKLKQFS